MLQKKKGQQRIKTISKDLEFYNVSWYKSQKRYNSHQQSLNKSTDYTPF